MHKVVTHRLSWFLTPITMGLMDVYGIYILYTSIYKIMEVAHHRNHFVVHIFKQRPGLKFRGLGHQHGAFPE